MTYLHKISSDEHYVTYEYGPHENSYIGTIKVQIDVPSNTPFSERDIYLEYYEDNSFCWQTSSALQGIAKFIRENMFPDNYIRATH